MGPLGHQGADAAQTDNAQHLVAQLHTLPARPLPAAINQCRMGLGDVAGLGQQQRHGVFGGRQGVGLRCVDHHHTLGGGCGHIHVVQANPGAAHHHKIIGRSQHLGGHLGGRTDDQSRRPGHQ